MPLEAGVEPAPVTDQSRSLGRTAAWLAKQVEIGLATVDLSLPQYRVLGLLDESTALSSDLASRLDVRPPTVTAVVDGLVTRGLVERRGVEGDRRCVSHALTPEGRRLLVAGDAAVFDRLSETVDALDADSDRALAFDGLEAWRRALLAAHLAREAAQSMKAPDLRTPARRPRWSRPPFEPMAVTARYEAPPAGIDPDKSLSWLRRAWPIMRAHKGIFITSLVLSFVGLVLQVQIPTSC